MKKIRIVILVIALLAMVISIPAAASTEVAVETPSGEYTYSYTDIVNRLIDPKALAVSGSGEDSNLFSSYGRKSVYNEETGEYENWNNNGDGSAYISKIDDAGDGSASELLLAEMNGPGYISRIWSAQPESGHLKIYIDEAESYGYVIDMPFIDYFDLTGFNYDSLCYSAAKGYNCYVPITYNKSCRVVAYSGWGRFYQINYTQLAEGTTVEPLASNGASSVAFTEAQAAALDRVNTFLGSSVGTNPSGSDDAEFETYSLESGESAIKEFSGKGAISGLLVKINNVDRIPDTAEEIITLLKALRLRIYWDGSTDAAVDVPLGDFFASSYGIDPVETLLMGVRDDRTFYSYYYMPYINGAKIVIENRGDTEVELQMSVTTEGLGVPEDTMLYFNSVFSFGEYVENRYPDHRFLSVGGEGRFVGLNLHLYKSTDYKMDESIPGHNWWGEGDEKFFVDGEKFPSWFGTGTEDFFGYAWCSTTLFTEAYHAQSYCTGGGSGIGNHVVTRIMMSDSVAFSASFEGCLEKYYEDTNYAYTSYLYLAPEATVERPDYTADDVFGYFVMEDDAYVQPLLEGEDLLALSYDGTLSTQNMMSQLNWSGDSHLFWKPSATAGQALTLSLPAGASEKYMILASFTNAPDFGIFSVSVNGNTIKEGVDLYASSVSCENLTELGAAELTKGYYGNTITFTLDRANEANTSGNMFFGLDFLLLIPYGEYTGTQNVDLSQYGNVSRKNCAITNFIEGEAMFVASKHATGTGAYSGQLAGGALSRGEQLFWRPAFGFYAWIELYLPAAKSGNYAIYASFMRASDFGIFETYVNGIAVGAPFDGYNPTLIVEGMTLLGTASLKEGYESNTIKFQMIGKNDNNTTSSFYMGLDFIVLVPIGEDLDISKYTDVSREVEATTQYAEGESLSGNATSGDILAQNAYTARTTDVWLSRGKQFFWKPKGDNAVGSVLELDFASLTAGKYAIVASFVSAADYGTFDIGVNGMTLLRNLDLYSSVVSSKNLTYVGTADLTAGYTNSMTVKVTGKNEKNTHTENRYYFSLDYLMLIPYEEYYGLEEIDLTNYTTVDRENAKHGLLIEGENLFVNRAMAMVQYHINWSNSHHNYWKETGTATANLPAPADGDYILAMAYTKAVDFGIFQISVNGTNVGCYQDLYNSSLKRNDLNIVGKVTLTKGYNTMTIKNVGKNASATSTLFGIDFIYLIPIEEYFGAEYVDVSGYTVRAVNTIIDETHTFDSNEDVECNVCGAQRDSIYTAPDGAVTKYGTIPAAYASKVTYPVLIFETDKTFVGGYAGWSTAINSINKSSGSYIMWVRRDIEETESVGVTNFRGNLTIDLDGHTLTMKRYGLDVYVSDSSNATTIDVRGSFTVKNGSIYRGFNTAKNSAYPFICINYDAASHNRPVSYTFAFESVTFSGERTSCGIILDAWEDNANTVTDPDATVISNVTFTDCTFDVASSTDGAKFLKLAGRDGYDRAIFNVDIIGGNIKADTAITLADISTVNGNGNGRADSLNIIKGYDNKYVTLTLPETAAAPAISSVWTGENGTELVMVKLSNAGGFTTYRLIPKAVATYVPKHSMTLWSDFIFNVYVPAANLVGITLDGSAVELSDGMLRDVDGVSCYKIPVNLAAKVSLRDIALGVTLEVDGESYNGSFTLNTLKYAKTILGTTAEADRSTEQKLVCDMLSYARAAYAYFTDADRDGEAAKLAEIDAILGESYDANNKAEAGTAADAPAKSTGFDAVTMQLDANLSFVFKKADSTDISKYTFTDSRGRALDVRADGNYVYVTRYAYAMCDTISFVGINADGDEVSGSYNVFTYYAWAAEDGNTSSSPELVTLVERFIKYCQSADAYRLSKA